MQGLNVMHEIRHAEGRGPTMAGRDTEAHENVGDITAAEE